MSATRILATLLFAAAMLAGSAARAPETGAQGFGLGAGNDDAPLEVYADNGIEWYQNESTYVARGNARAVKGDVTVYGDVLTAHYRKAEGGSEVWKVEAEGNVRIASPTETAYGDKAVYTIDDGLLLMTGKGLKLVTPRETITARDKLEYWEHKDLAVAQGDAVAISNDGRRIRADTLTAHFKPQDERKTQQAAAQSATAKPPAAKPATAKPGTAKPGTTTANAREPRGNSRLQRMEAIGNVVITTPEEIARGDRGVYFEDSGVATLTGSVKITRGQNQLNGEAAEVNLRTGISRMIPRPGANNAPVRALLVPQKPDEAPASGASPAPARRN